jgi:hypothetical protein
MEPIIKGAIPVLPAADTTESLNWWTQVCGFKETFRDNTPPTYVGMLIYMYVPERSRRTWNVARH